MGFPVHDWQFWIVTALAAAAALWLVRSLLPVPRRSGRGGRRGRGGRGRRATLTIDRKPVGRADRRH